MKTKIDVHFPVKQVKLSTKDKPFMNWELKMLDRKKKREYKRHGKSDKFLDLKSKFDENSKLQGKST